MDIGRATNCDLWLMTPPDGAPPCFGPRTSSAVRVAVYVDALVAQGVSLAVSVAGNPRSPLPEELHASYAPETNVLSVPDLALDAGSHLSRLAVCRAQYNVFRAVAEYLTHLPPGDPAAGDLRRQRPGFEGLPSPVREGVPPVLLPHLRAAFVRLYAFKELAMVCPPDQLEELGRLAPSPVVHPVDAPPVYPWEELLLARLGASALAALRAALDLQTDSINQQLDQDMELVLNRLAVACPPLHEHPFYSPHSSPSA